MNLHQIVAGPIGQVNRHETVKLFTCVSQTNVKGVITPSYTVSERRAQIQAPSPSDIQLNERVARAKHSIKVWLDAPADTINRVDQSAGDIIQRADGTYWLIVAIRESFAPEGWLSVICVEQTKPPANVIDPDNPDDPDDPEQSTEEADGDD